MAVVRSRTKKQGSLIAGRVKALLAKEALAAGKVEGCNHPVAFLDIGDTASHLFHNACASEEASSKCLQGGRPSFHRLTSDRAHVSGSKESMWAKYKWLCTCVCVGGGGGGGGGGGFLPMNSCPTMSPFCMPGMNPVYIWRSEPQIAVEVILRIASFCKSRPQQKHQYEP